MVASLVELQQAYRSGECSPDAVLAECLQAIDQRNGGLNAFLQVDEDGAVAAAETSVRRLAQGQPRALEGLPLAIKDNLDVAGMKTTAGMATRRDRSAETDATVVSRLRRAGAVILGKLNMTEAALGADGRNPHFGDCQHPWAPGYTPGGSSSGSAAAVAGGLVPAALGTDTMGSIRIPAAYCGIWGLKPSFGLVSTAGSVAVSRRLDHIGPLTTSLEDLELLLPVLAAFDPACPVSLPINLAAPRQSLRFGLPELGVVELDSEVAAPWQAISLTLSDSHLSTTKLPALDLEPGRIRRAGLLVCEAEMLIEHGLDWTDQRDNFSDELRALLDWGQRRSAPDLARAMRTLDQGRLALNGWLQQCDIVVLPTTPQRSFPYAQSTPANQADLTCLANCAGLPALSMPLPVADSELPCGLQLIGRHGADREVLAAARQLRSLVAG
ncbi:MAG: amidase [Wenzhouxiangella sp.]|nr:MAG: amidase [Wenzhouxiangella sp.]